MPPPPFSVPHLAVSTAKALATVYRLTILLGRDGVNLLWCAQLLSMLQNQLLARPLESIASSLRSRSRRSDRSSYGRLSILQAGNRCAAGSRVPSLAKSSSAAQDHRSDPDTRNVAAGELHTLFV